MSFGQISGLDVNAFMSQQTSPTTSLVGNEVAEVAGENFLAQVVSGQSSSAGVNTPSVVRAASTAADRLPQLSMQGRELDVVNQQTAFARVNERAENQGDSNPSGDEVAATGEDGAEGPQVTPAEVQNMQYDYDGDGIVSVEESETGQAIDAGIIEVATMIGANSVMSMMSQMEKDRARAEQLARS